jgi:hypothetical protein
VVRRRMREATRRWPPVKVRHDPPTGQIFPDTVIEKISSSWSILTTTRFKWGMDLDEAIRAVLAFAVFALVWLGRLDEGQTGFHGQPTGNRTDCAGAAGSAEHLTTTRNQRDQTATGTADVSRHMRATRLQDRQLPAGHAQPSSEDSSPPKCARP